MNLRDVVEAIDGYNRPSKKWRFAMFGLACATCIALAALWLEASPVLIEAIGAALAPVLGPLIVVYLGGQAYQDRGVRVAAIQAAEREPQ